VDICIFDMREECMCMFVCVNVRGYVYTFVCVWMRVYTMRVRVCMHVRVRQCAGVCMYICICVDMYIYDARECVYVYQCAG